MLAGERKTLCVLNCNMKNIQILIGGCSSSGKTTVSRKCCQDFKIRYYSLDEMRKENGNPIFSMLSIPEIWDKHVSHIVAVIKEIGMALRPIVEDWCAETKSGLLEGEGIEPKFVHETCKAVNKRAIYILETDTSRLHSTLFMRSESYRILNKSRQNKVISANAEYSKYLRSEAVKYNQPCIDSQPWSTLYSRIMERLL